MAKYKEGDKVRVIRNLEKDKIYPMQDSDLSDTVIDDMMEYAGKIVTISNIARNGKYVIEEDDNWWTDGMFEGLAEPEATPNPLHPIPIELQMADPPTGGTMKRALMFRAVMSNPPFDLISGSDLIQFVKAGKAYMMSYYTAVECKYDSSNNITQIRGIFNEVQPDTIGKCTNLTDKNGSDIWEHDIVELTLDGEKYRAIVHYDENGVWFERENDETYVYGEGCICAETDIEVLGNKFKNPELLEEEEVELEVTAPNPLDELQKAIGQIDLSEKLGLDKVAAALRNPWIF